MNRIITGNIMEGNVEVRSIPFVNEPAKFETAVVMFSISFASNRSGNREVDSKSDTVQD